MASGTAGRWIVGLLIYFILFFIVVFAYTQASADMVSQRTYSMVIAGTSDIFSLSDLSGYCTHPRSFNGVVDDSRYIYDTHCSGITDSNICSNILGCTFVPNTTTTTWFFTTFVPAHCDGFVNFSYLYTTPPAEITDTSFLSTGLLINTSIPFYLNRRISLADTPLVHNDQIRCENLGFTWDIASPESIRKKMDFSNPVKIGLFMFGFNSNLGFPDDAVGHMFNIIFSLIFAWLPFLALIVALLMYIPTT